MEPALFVPIGSAAEATGAMIAAEVTVVTCAPEVPAAILFTYVQLTPGGLGQREAAYVYHYGLAGVAASVATTTSLLVFSAAMTLAGVGGLCPLAERIFDLDRGDALT